MTCPWCVNGKCLIGDEGNCDYKKIPMEKDAIIKQIDKEFEFILQKLNELKKCSDENTAIKIIGVIKDKVVGIGTMRRKLLEKFNKNYFPKGRVKFAKTLLSVHKIMRKRR